MYFVFRPWRSLILIIPQLVGMPIIKYWYKHHQQCLDEMPKTKKKDIPKRKATASEKPQTQQTFKRSKLKRLSDISGVSGMLWHTELSFLGPYAVRFLFYYYNFRIWWWWRRTESRARCILATWLFNFCWFREFVNDWPTWNCLYAYKCAMYGRLHCDCGAHECQNNNKTTKHKKMCLILFESNIHFWDISRKYSI